MVQTYTIEEIPAEKIRSLFERTGSRTLYDTWFLSSTIKTRDITPIIKKKFKFKHVSSVERLTEPRENFQSNGSPP